MQGTALQHFSTWLCEVKYCQVQGALDAVMALYLGISIPPISLSLRCTLSGLLAGVGNPQSPARHVLETVLPLAAALCIALTCPQVRGFLSKENKKMYVRHGVCYTTAAFAFPSRRPTCLFLVSPHSRAIASWLDDAYKLP